MVCHYSPADHALERRAEFPLETWQELTKGLPEPVLLVGLTSVHWREAWKYGERAYRYCQHDVGHAMAAVSLAAAALGWQATLLDDLGTDALATLLGVGDPQGAEAEEPDCVLAVYPQGTSVRTHTLPSDVLETFATLPWQGKPNVLSRGHVEWPMIERVTAATKKPATDHVVWDLSADGPTARGRFGAGFVSADYLSAPQRRRLGWPDRASRATRCIKSWSRPWPGRVNSPSIPFPGRHSFTWPSLSTEFKILIPALCSGP